jgi:hypothetical protein
MKATNILEKNNIKGRELLLAIREEDTLIDLEVKNGNSVHLYFNNIYRGGDNSEIIISYEDGETENFLDFSNMVRSTNEILSLRDVGSIIFYSVSNFGFIAVFKERNYNKKVLVCIPVETNANLYEDPDYDDYIKLTVRQAFNLKN